MFSDFGDSYRIYQACLFLYTFFFIVWLAACELTSYRNDTCYPSSNKSNDLSEMLPHQIKPGKPLIPTVQPMHYLASFSTSEATQNCILKNCTSKLLQHGDITHPIAIHPESKNI